MGSLLFAACGGADEVAAPVATGSASPAGAAATPTTTPTLTSTPGPTATATTTPTPTATPSSTVADADEERLDLIDYGAGTFPIRFDHRTQGEFATAALDGLGGHRTVETSVDGNYEQTLTVELAAPSTFDTFGVPAMSVSGCCYGKHVATVEVEGSSTGPDDGFEPLVAFDVDIDAAEGPTLVPSDSDTEVRWLRLSISGRQVADPEDYGGTLLSDVIGYGAQQERPFVEGEFTGIWLTGGGGGDGDGNRIEMRQDGALVRGCRISGGSAHEFTGGIENGILKLLAVDGVPSLYVIQSDATLFGVEIGRSYGRVIGESGGNPTSCFPVEGEGGTGEADNAVTQAIDACDAAVVYGVNFDVDEDTLRPDADPALHQILDALAARPDATVTIAGHTDSDGSDEYNLDLSDRRAASVVAWLTDRGVDAGRLESVGRGEAEPIADNESSAGRAANRRTEIVPTC